MASNSIRAVIFSSREGLTAAHALKGHLQAEFEVIVWNENAFPLTENFLEGALHVLDAADFAILLLTRDTFIHQRQSVQQAPRDNLVFEAGLSLARLGKKNTLLVVENVDEIRLPDYLTGITPAYFCSQTNSDLHQALGSAAGALKRLDARQAAASPTAAGHLELDSP